MYVYNMYCIYMCLYVHIYVYYIDFRRRSGGRPGYSGQARIYLAQIYHSDELAAIYRVICDAHVTNS